MFVVAETMGCRWLRCPIFFVMLLVLAARLEAQEDRLRARLLFARDAYWTVRVSTSTDTIVGVVRTLLRDSVRVDTTRIPIAEIARLERRAGGDEWKLEWPLPQPVRTPGDSSVYLGPATFVFAGPVMLLFPEVGFGAPPPLIAGVEVSNRKIDSEISGSARALIYPLPFLIIGLDVGRNWFEGKTFYRGLAAGLVFSPAEESDFALNVGMRLGSLAQRGGGRGELRADAILINGELGVVLSGVIGFSRGRLQ